MTAILLLVHAKPVLMFTHSVTLAMLLRLINCRFIIIIIIIIMEFVYLDYNIFGNTCTVLRC